MGLEKEKGNSCLDPDFLVGVVPRYTPPPPKFRAALPVGSVGCGVLKTLPVGSVGCGVLNMLPGRSISGLTDFSRSGVLKRREVENGENTPLSSSEIPIPVMELE